ncbi:MAG: flagellar basal body rod protein FlgB [Deltaproteobacteria bacterium]|nr:flagellar basal body rod protein FlgB [Deltaproteobacteria bacterium]
MAGFILFGPTQQLLATAMRLRAVRHELLTANIANADTPEYRPRDLHFAEVLQALAHPEGQPAGTQEGRLMLVSTHPLHLHPALGSASLVAGEAGEGKLDRNRVDLDHEIAQLSENVLLHETSLTLLSRTLGGLRYAISEGKG